MVMPILLCFVEKNTDAYFNIYRNTYHHNNLYLWNSINKKEAEGRINSVFSSYRDICTLVIFKNTGMPIMLKSLNIFNEIGKKLFG